MTTAGGKMNKSLMSGLLERFNSRPVCTISPRHPNGPAAPLTLEERYKQLDVPTYLRRKLSIAGLDNGNPL
jgi:hypothetical protein